MQFGIFEIKQQADTQTSDLQIIQNLSPFVVGYFVDGFCINHDLVKDNQVGDILTDLDGFIGHIESRLLIERNLPQAKFNT